MVRKTVGKDVQYQALRFFITEAGADTFTEKAIATPNLTEAGYVMELLRIKWNMRLKPDLNDGDWLGVDITENQRTALANYSESGTVFVYAHEYKFITSGSQFVWLSGDEDYTDGSGNGLLIGRKELFAHIQGSGQSGALDFHAVLFYRLKKVTPAELVGLISG